MFSEAPLPPRELRSVGPLEYVRTFPPLLPLPAPACGVASGGSPIRRTHGRFCSLAAG